MNADELEEIILKEITPSDEEISSLEGKAHRLEELVKKFDKEHGYNIKVKFAGSFSKGTYLSNPDFDVFLMFPRDMDRKTMTNEGLSVGESLLDRAERAFAENPYISGFFEGMDVDMVPCYDLPDATHIITSMDRTPFHTDFIKSNLDLKGRDQVRLLKKFMKGIGAYGAEPSSRGFSGYLCELLIVRYGSFRKTLEAAVTWGQNPKIHITGFEGPSIKSPLLFNDPVDVNRNVASAVHEDTLCLFITAAKEYLKEPRREFFFPNKRQPLDGSKLEEACKINESRLVSVSFPKPEILEDSLHAQMWKTQYALSSKIESFGFGLLRAHHIELENTFEIAIELERDVLSAVSRRIGPPVWVSNSEDFLNKWKGCMHGEPFIENGRWNVIADRQYTDVKSMLISEAAHSGIGKDVDASSMTVRNHDETLKSTDKRLLTGLLFPMMPWTV